MQYGKSMPGLLTVGAHLICIKTKPLWTGVGVFFTTFFCRLGGHTPRSHCFEIFDKFTRTSMWANFKSVLLGVLVFEIGTVETGGLFLGVTSCLALPDFLIGDVPWRYILSFSSVPVWVISSMLLDSPVPALMVIAAVAVKRTTANNY